MSSKRQLMEYNKTLKDEIKKLQQQNIDIYDSLKKQYDLKYDQLHNYYIEEIRKASKSNAYRPLFYIACIFAIAMLILNII